jgi:hypothetical protein
MIFPFYMQPPTGLKRNRARQGRKNRGQRPGSATTLPLLVSSNCFAVSEPVGACADAPNPGTGYNIEIEDSYLMLKRALILASVFTVILVLSAQWAVSQQEDQGVPAYNAAPPPKGKKLPPILPKENLWAENAQYPHQTHAYELAAKIPNVLHQQPCYCYCDRGMGHNSLHSCFENTHGAQCDVCLKELYYSYGQTKKGKTAAQIRKGIISGEWKQVDVQAAAATMN